MSKTTKREAKKRPTFTEVRKYLRTKSEGNLDKKEQDLTNGKPKRSILAKNEDVNNDPNFKNKDYNENLLSEVTTETFIANKYATRMWKEMAVDQELKYESLKA